MSTFQKVLLPIVAVVALAGVGLGTAGLLKASSDNSTLKRQVATLKSDLGRTQSALGRTQAALNSTSQSDLVSKLVGEFHTFQLCVPQLQQEIGGLNVNSSTQNGYMTSAYITNPTIISRDCNRTIYGNSSGNGN